MALNPASIASAARVRSIRARHELHQAEEDLHSAHELLASAVPEGDPGCIQEALEQSKAAEEHVQHASDELEVVNALLDDRSAADRPAGSGEGLQSLVQQLRRT